MPANYQCKKVAFATEADADFYIEKLKRTSSRKVVPTRAYLCETCRNWHLTHVQNIDVQKVLYGYEKRIRELEKQLAEADKTIVCLNRAITEFRSQPAARPKAKTKRK